MEHNNAGSTAANLRSPRGGSSSSEQLSQKLQEQAQQQQQQHHQQQQHQTQPHHQQQHHNSQTSQQQQQNNEHQQQFCLRWHNHQTSLLSTLPILLDQSHLTDVTISAEGRTLRAHRVVLSACSSFFLEIFRTLDNTHHPVIIIPGASFQAIVALLTFMYSGEVNVYEEQIPTLLSLAETLGIKGLADVHNNLQKSHKTTIDTTKDSDEPEKAVTPPTPPPSSSSQATSGSFTIPQPPAQQTSAASSLPTSPFSPLLNPALNSKFPSPLENFFLKSLQFYPNLMHQPLNFSQTALNKTSEILAKYQQQCNLYQANLAMNSKDLIPLLHNDEGNRSAMSDDLHGGKRFCSGLDKKVAMSAPQMCSQNTLTQTQQKDIKRIDKIVENLRGSTAGSCGAAGKLGSHDNNDNRASLPSHLQNQLSPLTIKTTLDNYATTTSPLMAPKSSLFSSPTSAEPNSPLHHPQLNFNISAEDQLKLQQHLDKYAASCAAAAAAAGNMTPNDNLKPEHKTGSDKLTTPQSPQNKAPSNSKLYATCFICHKQLSNQYNLRVHLETHQNVRYACNVCSHVSRSKDALRKHVSYRHPGAPSPCETEARRKRANKLLASTINASAAAAAAVSAATSAVEDIKPNLPNTPPALQQTPSSFQMTSAGPPTNERICSSEQILPASPQQQLTAAQLSSAYQMFVPNQFHLAAANAVQQHLRGNQQQQSPTASTPPTPSTPTTAANKDFVGSLTTTTAGHSGQNNLPGSASPDSGEVNKSATTNSPTHTPTPEYTTTPNTLNSLGDARNSPSVASP